jgi:hypothetical protein
MPAAFYLLLIAIPLAAQGLVDPAKLPAEWKSFASPEKEDRLRCRVQPQEPSLTLGFSFQTGYRVEVPMSQYLGDGNWLQAVLRVTPEETEREPVWLTSRIRLPRVPETRVTAEFGGGFLVGEGKYEVYMLLVDNKNRRCVADWTVKAKASKEVREIGAGLRPGTIDDISLRRTGRSQLDLAANSSEPGHDISVLMHVSSLSPRRYGTLRSYDRILLLNALVSMLDRLPLRNVRLTLFSLEQHAEVYHTERLSRETFAEAVDALNNVQLGTVDYSVHQNRKGHLDLFSELLNRELSHSETTDAVIILGPRAPQGDRVPAEDLPPKAGAPPVYYAELRPWRRVYAILPDTITRTVKRLGGRTKEIYNPQDFAEAIRDVERLLLEQQSRAGI